MTKTDIAKGALRAYVDGDRAVLEALIADSFRFTSPYDNGLDRQTYFTRCWPFHEITKEITFVRAIEQGDEVVVTYEVAFTDGKVSRNTEVFTVRADRIEQVEVYFGWTLPHMASAGGFVDPASAEF